MVGLSFLQDKNSSVQLNNTKQIFFMKNDFRLNK
jgi:hypothetical protein